jgi:hypothetical protein
MEVKNAARFGNKFVTIEFTFASKFKANHFLVELFPCVYKIATEGALLLRNNNRQTYKRRQLGIYLAVVESSV